MIFYVLDGNLFMDIEGQDSHVAKAGGLFIVFTAAKSFAEARKP